MRGELRWTEGGWGWDRGGCKVDVRWMGWAKVDRGGWGGWGMGVRGGAWGWTEGGCMVVDGGAGWGWMWVLGGRVLQLASRGRALGGRVFHLVLGELKRGLLGGRVLQLALG